MPNGICFKKIAIENRDLLNAALAREAALQTSLDAVTFNLDKTDKALLALQNSEAALREELERLKREAEQDTTIDERDRYHEISDSLALAISKHFRVEIGEHSSMNCPWSVALEVMNGAYITDTNEGRERDALQQRLTDAEKRTAELEGLLREVANIDPRGEFLGWQLDGKIGAVLNPAEEGEGS